MAYKVIILYRLYMPPYFLGTFTEYPSRRGKGGEEMNCGLQDCYFVYVNIAKCKIVLNI
jgi:hypothetical protein